MAPPAEKSPRSQKSSELDRPYVAGDLIPAPEAVERGDSAWGLFNELSRQQEARFADTAPASQPMALAPGEHAGWAATQPMKPVAAPAAARAAAAPAFTLESAMLVARKNNRVCPRPERWAELMALLPPRKTMRGIQHPPSPVTGPAWFVTPALTKRLCFREHVEWAERTGVLESVMAFMQDMAEEDWLHMGED